jgi:hypothetical protein
MDPNTVDRGGNPSEVSRACPFWKRMSDVTNGSHRNGGIGFFAPNPTSQKGAFVRPVETGRAPSKPKLSATSRRCCTEYFN